MRYFDENRRRLMNKSFIRGLPNTVSSDSNQVQITDSAGVPLNGLSFRGATQQETTIPIPQDPAPIKNSNSDKLSIIVGDEELIIPKSVTVDGRSISLPFTKYDKLIVNRLTNSVIYQQGSGYKELKGTESFGRITMTGSTPRFTILPSQLGFSTLTGEGYCSHFGVEISMYFKNDPLDYGSPKSITFLYNLNSADEFKAWLASQYAAGNPVTIVAEYEEPNDVDITRTSFAEALLKMKIPYGQDGYVIAQSDVAPSELSVSYYSMNDQDEIELTVRCVDLFDNELKNSQIYNVRFGSRYLATPPHIQGYRSLTESQEGYIREPLEITFTYDREE